ncbi:glycosyltransferase family protein [Desulfosudis oleivorans]|uniref:Spore protein YkvP/CgeB glycosyl transferase-like domain-containing protein n=1 Tax=Desulfosudis oleivorans (strain DSM 6200 / JCM 39069 / Hxd3) TaxID=96561 RepID=A8ZZ89_DESOH|nr:glycosyltransferase [Desulfosudis oleivorans]ABW67242.1 conserved hypothetical protein [Desulfosudis oleivorans Hxd3]
MRIVHAAIFNTFKYGHEYYSMDRKISNGLIREGHFVYDFSYRDVCRAENPFKTTSIGKGKMNRLLILTVDAVQPHLLLLGHSEMITAETLNHIRTTHPDIRIGLWYVDPLFHTDRIQHLIKRRGCMDAMFITTGGDLLRQFKTPENRIAFLPNISDPSVDINTNHEKERFDIDFIFGGSDSKEPERQAFLKNMTAALGKTMRCELWGALGNPFYTDHQFYEKLSRAKMGLNLSRRNDVYLYTSNRITQLAGSGILTFSPRVPGLEKVYSENEVVYFDGLDDLVKKANYFHTHDDERKQIASAGWDRTHRSYNCQRVTRFMLDLLFEQPFSEPYEWISEII